jgi:iron complex transport system ATP-binding protein
MTTAIELERVSARYSGSVAASDATVAGVTMRVEAGELVAVLGPNGAGKTTLLRVLAGALAPFEGEVRLFGEPMGGMPRADVARRVAVVAQTEEIAFGFAVRDVVAMGRAPHQRGWMRETAHDRDVVESAMRRCDVGGLAARRVDELSGGEQKRVAIARALAQEPRVLLLDEPAAFLDVRHQIDLYELLADEVASQKLACVVVMHDLNAAAQYASRVVLAKGGRIVAAGSVADVMTWQRLKETFDADLYVGVNELTGDRFFLPMRRATRAPA